jgi:aminoglycoside phosphotransferase (APT) family kinase protein
VQQLSDTLREHYGQLGITGLREIGRGLDARVYRADSVALGPVAIRVPHARWLNDANDPELDSRLLLRQEYQLSGYLRAHGLPVPEMFVLHTGDDGVDFTIARYVESDGSQLPEREFGRLIRAAHEVPAPPVELVGVESLDDADQVLARRIGLRLTALAEVGPAPDIGAVLAASHPDALPRCLLHMDLRPENILVRSGQAAALIDWSNALVGDPALDLARTAEYGNLSPAALAGYGDPGSFRLTSPTSPTELTDRQAVYHLDTAVMLSHVFLDGAPDHAQARHYIGRTRELCRLLARG